MDYFFCTISSSQKDLDPGSGDGSKIPDFHFEDPNPKLIISEHLSKEFIFWGCGSGGERSW